AARRRCPPRGRSLAWGGPALRSWSWSWCVQKLTARGHEAGRGVVVKNMATRGDPRLAGHPHRIDRAGAVAGEDVRGEHLRRRQTGQHHVAGIEHDAVRLLSD